MLANGVEDPADLPEKDIRRAMPRFSADNWPKNRALLQAFNAIATREGVTPAQLSLSWVLAQGDHIVAIPGTANVPHLEENIARWECRLPDNVAQEVDALINQNTVAGVRYGGAMQNTVYTEEFQ